MQSYRSLGRLRPSLHLRTPASVSHVSSPSHLFVQTSTLRTSARLLQDEDSSGTSEKSNRFVPPEAPKVKGQSSGPRKGPRVGTLFIGLVIIGIATTTFGLVDFFGTFATWPKELRDDLRTAVKAQKRGDPRRAEAHYRKALAIARELEPSKLEPSRLLKISGISIALGGLLESEGEYGAAYQEYAKSLDEVLGGDSSETQASTSTRTPQERLRAVSLAQKLGDLASNGLVSESDLLNLATVTPASVTGQKDQSVNLDVIAERNYVWSVEELLRIAMSTQQRESAREADMRGEQGGVVIADLELPSEWGLSHTELGASMEALGGFYARKGKAELAVPLYLQALSTLMPPAGTRKREGKQPTASERCRAGILMNNLSQLFFHALPGSTAGLEAVATGMAADGGMLGQARAWAEKGLDLVQSTQRMAGWEESGQVATKKVVKTTDERAEQVRLECAGAEITLLYNLGVIYETLKDKCKARELYQKAYKRAEEVRFRDARHRSAQALANLERHG